MTTGYDGSIRIDTRINTGSLERGISQIEYMLESLSSGISEFQDNFADAGDGFSQIEDKLTSIAAIIGMAFGAEELINFGKQAVDAASDLAEAQNVVDTAFGDMSYKMEKFADTALETYGISELTAKNMGSTYMAMAKGMGVATDAASDMAVTLTGRLSDIMSFYNKTQSEVDTIGRAIITGETEPLKAIGVVMSQTNLSAYAMAQGFSKTYAEMSSNEQLLVRYKYFLEQTAMAQGDFAKTSEGWANQTRMLSERLNEFMTNLGNVLINTLTPALQFVNEAVMFLNDLFFGGESAEDATAVKNAEAVTDEVTAVGAAADKSEKKLNNLLSSFDELHIISGAKSEDENTDAGIDTSGLLGASLDADNKIAEKSSGKYRKILDEIYLAFKQHPLTKTIKKIIKQLGEFFGVIKENGDISAGDIVTALMDILGAIIAFKTISGVVGGIKTFASGFSGLIGIITAHPVVAAIVGITALTIGIIALEEELKRQRIASHFGDISISLEEIKELTDPITEGTEKVAGAFRDNAETLVTAKENFKNLADALDKTFETFGSENVEQDIDGLVEKIDELTTAALQVNAATFDTSSWEALYMMDDGVIDAEERAALDEIEEMGSSIAEKITSYSQEIHKITEAAAEENRKLTEAEIANIKNLYQKLKDLTMQTEEAKSDAAWERLKQGMYTFDSYNEFAEAFKNAQEQSEKSRKEIMETATESVMEVAGAMEREGKSAADIEAFKNKKFEEIKEELEAGRKNDKRNERDVILAWAQGYVKNTTESYTNDPEAQENIQKIFDMYIKGLGNDDAVPVDFAVMNAYDRNQFDAVDSILKDLEKYSGIDLVDELTQLNEEIGDSAYSLDEFYDAALKVADSFTPISVEDIFPTLEEVKEQPQKWSEILSEWVEAANFSITATGEFDEESFEKDMNAYFAGHQMQFKLTPTGLTEHFTPVIESSKTTERSSEDMIRDAIEKSGLSGFELQLPTELNGMKFYPSPSNYAQPVMGPQTMEQTLKLQLWVNDVDKGTQTIKTNGSSTINIDRWKDMTVTNGQ